MMSSVRPTVHHEISTLCFPSFDVPRLMKPILEQDQLPKIARNFPIQNLHFNFLILSLTCVSTRSETAPLAFMAIFLLVHGMRTTWKISSRFAFLIANENLQ